mgnify:CR=1 FL=1
MCISRITSTSPYSLKVHYLERLILLQKFQYNHIITGISWGFRIWSQKWCAVTVTEFTRGNVYTRRFRKQDSAFLCWTRNFRRVFRRSFPAESLVPSLREAACLSVRKLRYKKKQKKNPITEQCTRIPSGCENSAVAPNSAVSSGVGEQELNRRITINIRKLREMIHTIGDSALSRLRTEDICRGGASLGASKSEVAPTTSGEVYVVHTWFVGYCDVHKMK